MADPVRLYFDFISPYAYLAWTQVHALAGRYGRPVDAVPILFAALLDENGQKGPAEIPNKRVYIFKDVLRTARVLGVPLEPPPSHPFNPLLALRACSLLEDREERRRAVDALFRATWAGGPGVTDPEVVARALVDAGLDGPALVEQAGSEQAKARVRAQTEEALAAGAFGVPTLLVDGELFWGYDAFAHAERRLQGKDPLEGLDWQRWRDLPASSVRKAVRGPGSGTGT